MKHINLSTLVGKFTMVKHDYDTEEFIKARIDGKVMALNEILRIDQPYIKHNLHYIMRVNSKRYVISVYDTPTYIVDTKLCFSEFDSKQSLDELLK